jgi:outer membrane protein assembly complex protein YaeT
MARIRRASFPLALALAPALALALPGTARGLQQDGALPADSLEVSSVDFEGARAFDDDLLATAIVTAPTRCIALQPLCWLDVGVDRQFLDARALGADVVRLRVFYYQHGYREAEVSVDTVRAGDAMRVTFRIGEGRPVLVSGLSIQGADGLPRSLTGNLPLAVGQPLSLVAYEAARDTIISRLANQGYALADVLAGYEITSDAPYAATVRYELIPGSRARFGAIDVAGAVKVSPRVVRRMLTFRTGDVYTRDAVLRSQRNLFGQELFRHAEIRVAPRSTGDTVMDVRVQVNEGELHRVRFGLGLSTAEFLNAEGRWTSRSFMGGARRLELRGRIANLFAHQLDGTPLFEESRDIYGRVSGSIAADFSQPWLFGPLNTLGAGVFFERRSLPNVFVRTSGGGYVSFARALGEGETFTAGYRPELTKLETAEGDQIFCFGFVACGPREIEALRSPHWLSPVAASFVRDRSNSIFAPTRGYLIRLDGEYAGPLTASDFGYTRLLADVTDYHTFGRGLVWAARLRGGWARATGADSTLGVHPQKRFFAGGPNSVRGYAQYRLGPKLLTVDAANRLARPIEEGGAGCSAQSINDGSCDAGPLADAMPDIFNVQPVGGAVLVEGNIEVRFPVFRDRIRGAAFIDFGQVWPDQDDPGLDGLAWTPGFGVRYFSAVGPIRVDIGYNPQGAERVPVVTTEVEHCPAGQPPEEIEPGTVYDFRDLCNTRTLRSLEPVSWQPRETWFDRLQLHFSIGQAF